MFRPARTTCACALSDRAGPECRRPMLWSSSGEPDDPLARFDFGPGSQWNGVPPMPSYRQFANHRTGPLATGILVTVLVSAVYTLRWNEPALATSTDNPYTVPLVTDTNPDPTIVETTI